jgi:hypothetical protein
LTIIISNEIRSKLKIIYPYNQKVDVIPKKLEIRQSMNIFAGFGAGTIFFECPHNADGINQKINDLAYHGQSCDYDVDENIEKNINVGYLVREPEDQWMKFLEVVLLNFIYMQLRISINSKN